jgi:hypothetical protein
MGSSRLLCCRRFLGRGLWLLCIILVSLAASVFLSLVKDLSSVCSEGSNMVGLVSFPDDMQTAA